MGILERIGNAGVVPVVVIEDAKDAVPTAQALLKGGIDVMEVTMRTAAALDSIRSVAQSCPEMLVGAGTVITLDQGRKAVEAGAQFIVSPGLNRALVQWCVDGGVAVTPGCVTPTEIMGAMELGLSVFKFFPADVYGGLNAMKALSGPFGSVRFIPTGGVNAQNLGEYIEAPFIHAVGGSWLSAKKDISDGNFDKITALCAQARKTVLGFEVGHIGINLPDAKASIMLMGKFSEVFGFEGKPGNNSNFAGGSIEIMKNMYLGENGHIAIRTAGIDRAITHLKAKGYDVDMNTAKFKGEKLAAVYLKGDFGGFAVHLVQK